MPDYTTPITATPGFTLPAGDWNAGVRDSLEALAKPNSCKLIRNAAWAGTVANGAVVAVPFNAAKWDSVPAMFNPANPTRITIPVAGRYLLAAGFYMTGAGGTYRGIQITKGSNNTTPGLDYRGPGPLSILTVSCEDVAAVGDWYHVAVQQDTGAAQGLGGFNLEGYCWFSARLIGR